MDSVQPCRALPGRAGGPRHARGCPVPSRTVDSRSSRSRRAVGPMNRPATSIWMPLFRHRGRAARSPGSRARAAPLPAPAPNTPDVRSATTSARSTHRRQQAGRHGHQHRHDAPRHGRRGAVSTHTAPPLPRPGRLRSPTRPGKAQDDQPGEDVPGRSMAGGRRPGRCRAGRGSGCRGRRGAVRRPCGARALARA